MEPDPTRAVALGATDATVTAAGPGSADRPHGGAPALVAPAATAAQPASAAAGEDAVAAAAQAVPSNVNVSVRIFSPGNDGPVTQTNTAGPVSVTTTTPPTQPASPATSPAAVPPTSAIPTSWVWNWTWDAGAAGCTVAPQPSTSTVSGSTWTWNWVWPCAPALPAIPVPDLPGFMPRPDAAPAQASTPAAGAEDESPAAGGPSSRSDTWVPLGRPGIRRSLATRERVDDSGQMWATLGASSTGRGRGGADSGADAAPAVARVVDATLGTLFHSGLTASAAAATAAASGGAGISGLGVGAAALLAALVLFAPPLLIPLKAASARRLQHVSTRRDRPG